MQTKQTYARIALRLAKVFLCAGLCSMLYAGQQGDTTLKPALPASVKSEFRDDPKFGRDPFFPNSERRKATNEAVQVDVPAAHYKFRLQGISGPMERRLAIIQNRTFAVGEEADMKIEGKPLKVRCLEIKEQSVIIEVNGSKQEISLGGRF
jgi:hypothetical protein